MKISLKNLKNEYMDTEYGLIIGGEGKKVRWPEVIYWMLKVELKCGR